jgi:hypothetical protein
MAWAVADADTGISGLRHPEHSGSGRLRLCPEKESGDGLSGNKGDNVKELGANFIVYTQSAKLYTGALHRLLLRDRI